jgi:hypothetical protein
MKEYILIYSTVSGGTEFKTFDYESELIVFVEDLFKQPDEEFNIISLYKGIKLQYEFADRVKSIKIKR